MNLIEVYLISAKLLSFVDGKINEIQPYLEFVIALGGIGSIVFGIIAFSRKLLHKIISPYRAYFDFLKYNYSKEYRNTLSKYYIPTRAQEIDPCNQEEIRENNGKFSSFPLITFFKKEAFKQSSSGKYYLVFADSGMGKTTFLLKLYRKCIPYVLRHKYEKIEMVHLVDKDCIGRIHNIPNAERTILLLDGLDENSEAMENCDNFFSSLISETAHFNKIVITCRTQFYASAKDEPFRTGVIHVGNGNKSCEIVKKYISPFSDEEVRLYLKKRFRLKRKIQKKAMRIVYFVPDIMVRPIVLNWIEFLCDAEKEYQYTYQIYNTIIHKWIEREELECENKLLELSIEITNYMYESKTTTIPVKEVDKIALKNHIDLKPIIAKSRSLLNRNSAGVYKFAHRSFLEYFIVYKIFRNMRMPDDTDFLWSLSGAKRFLFEQLISSALQTDEYQVEVVNQQISDSKDYTRANNIMEFLLRPKVQLNSRNGHNGFTIEAWLFYLPVEGYDGKDTFNITKYFSAIEGSIHQSIQNEGVDVGVKFDVSTKNKTIQTQVTVKVLQKHVSFATEALV